MALSSLIAVFAGFVNMFIAFIAIAEVGCLFYALFFFWDMVEAIIAHR